MRLLIIQIPCFNEEDSLPVALAALPRRVEGFERVEWLIIDDGSTDRTVEVARAHGVDHVVRHSKNRGLARAFATGLEASLRLGADVIVNTDADNQYEGGDIPALVWPILEGRADMVVGDRRTGSIPHFSWVKKRLQGLGSWVVRQASGTSVPDATSGFRAYSREAALQLNIVTDFTYTLESIIQAGHKNLAVAHVPVRTHSPMRDSRLFRSMRAYVSRSIGTIVRIYSMYRPLKVFVLLGLALFLCGFALGLRFLYFKYWQGNGTGHVQSLLLAVLLMVVGFQTGVTGLLADLIAHNRRLIEEALLHVRREKLGAGTERASTGLERKEAARTGTEGS